MRMLLDCIRIEFGAFLKEQCRGARDHRGRGRGSAEHRPARESWRVAERGRFSGGDHSEGGPFGESGLGRNRNEKQSSVGKISDEPADVRNFAARKNRSF